MALKRIEFCSCLEIYTVLFYLSLLRTDHRVAVRKGVAVRKCGRVRKSVEECGRVWKSVEECGRVWKSAEDNADRTWLQLMCCALILH
jgi:hypothetical protein